MDSQWLKNQFICNPDKSKAGLAEALDLEPPAISKILNGTRQVKAKEYGKMRRYFGLPVDGEHATAQSPPANTYKLETLPDQQTLQDGVEEANDDSWSIPASVINQRTQAPPEKVKTFQIKESVMEPDYKNGEQVLVDLSDTRPSPPGAFIIYDGFGYALRFCEFVPKSDPPEIKISAPAKGFQTQRLPLEMVEIIGRAIGKLQWT